MPDSLIWSFEHNAWWAPNERGYTIDILQAGHYTRERAEQICANANAHSDLPNEAVVPRALIPVLSSYMYALKAYHGWRS